jgi:hypothetical protein
MDLGIAFLKDKVLNGVGNTVHFRRINQVTRPPERTILRTCRL